MRAAAAIMKIFLVNAPWGRELNNLLNETDILPSNYSFVAGDLADKPIVYELEYKFKL